LQHPFPGNIRELRTMLERASLLCDGDRIQPEHLWLDTLAAPAANPGAGFHSPLLPLAGLEQRYLAWALASHQGDRASLAVALGITERTLYRKLATLQQGSAGTPDATP
ncbi:MAG: helix-turn-helix domain-containing protein, partial [Vogesella sp.]|uniref:helix-turn-helix domain-containing protein n=1 Tax=Vogesella sp. TaxID=1904252 RepID=UPI003F337D26